jgi:hypothetical protein
LYIAIGCEAATTTREQMMYMVCSHSNMIGVYT